MLINAMVARTNEGTGTSMITATGNARTTWGCLPQHAFARSPLARSGGWPYHGSMA
jgi:hypothetical protein